MPSSLEFRWRSPMIHRSRRVGPEVDLPFQSAANGLLCLRSKKWIFRSLMS
jgi:hypothetical protein